MNSPVLRPDGGIQYIIHRVEDVTEFVRLKRKGAEASKLAQELQVRTEQMEAETFLRAQEVQEANRKLQTANEELVHALRARPEFDRTPLVLLTAKADDELRVRLLWEGGAGLPDEALFGE